MSVPSIEFLIAKSLPLNVGRGRWTRVCTSHVARDLFSVIHLFMFLVYLYAVCVTLYILLYINTKRGVDAHRCVIVQLDDEDKVGSAVACLLDPIHLLLAR